MESAILEASSQRPKPETFNPSYGTAGFRSKAHLLPSTVFRCGILMALRSLQTKKITGICITASHNPAPDNGVKLVEPSGEMLLQEYEPLADQMANAESPEKLLSIVKECIETEKINLHQENAKVLLAYDTRPSGKSLARDAAAGVETLGVSVEILGEMTTPQLHWAVMRSNQNMNSSENAYYALFAQAFANVTGQGIYKRRLHVDCANGVGAQKLEAMHDMLKKIGLDIILHNTGEGTLNHLCGSDYVQKERTLPLGMQDLEMPESACAIDGDADRLVYFYRKDENSNDIILLDGDKIAALVAGLFKELVAELPGELSSSSIGVVQTAYANGNSTRYLVEAVGCEVAVTPTGVKHLHKAAHNFDIGIYFEANGHGTVLFNKSFMEALVSLQDKSKAAFELLSLNKIINEAVGDAISDILLVETALVKRNMTLLQWSALYEDLPSLQLKAEVKDRSIIVTEDAERRVAQPPGLQLSIDKLVSKYTGARSFVRPSGTEDIVRIYAEAQHARDAQDLAMSVQQLVADMLS